MGNNYEWKIWFQLEVFIGACITRFFPVARSTSPGEDFQLNQNLSIIIISHAKMIFI